MTVFDGTHPKPSVANRVCPPQDHEFIPFHQIHHTMNMRTPSKRKVAPLARSIAKRLGVSLLVAGAAHLGWPKADAADESWSTNPGSNKFSDVNWTSGQTPGAAGNTIASGDRLFFGSSTLTNLFNDDSGFTFSGLVFNSGASPFVIAGNSFTLSGGITNNSSSTQRIDNSIVLSATQTINANTGSISLSGIISGAGFGLNKTGSGLLTLTGANTYTGATTISVGTIGIVADNNLGTSAAALTLDGGTLKLAGGSVTNTHAITATANGGAISNVGFSYTLAATVSGSNTVNLAGPAAGSVGYTGNVINGVGNYGNFVFNGTSTFNGVINVGSGANIEYASSTALSSATLNVNSGGRIEASSGVTVSNNITVANGGSLGFQNANTGIFSGTITLSGGTANVHMFDWYNYATARSGTISGKITGTGGLNIFAINGATLTASGANDYSGATTLTNVGLTLNGASGSIAGSSGSTLNNSTITLDYSTAIVDKLKDTGAVTLNQNSFLAVTANATTNTTETLGTLGFAGGSNTVTIGSATGRVTTLAAASLSRTNNSTALIRGASLNQSVATNVSRLALADGGASLAQVGTNTLNNGGTADTTQALKIVPYLVGDTSTTGNGSQFMTYDSALGLRALLAGEYATLTAAYTNAANPDNALAFSGTLSTTSDVTVNSLKFGTATQTLNGSGGKLIVNSGAILVSDGLASEVIGSGFGGLTLGNGTWNEGVISVQGTGALTINTPIGVTGSGGLTKGGAGTLTLGAANSYTGQTTVNQGTLAITAGINNVFNGTTGTALVLGNNATVNINSTTQTVSSIGLFGSGETVSGTSGTLNLAGNITFDATANENTTSTISVTTLNLNGTRTANVGDSLATLSVSTTNLSAPDLVISSVIADGSTTGGLTKTGAGTLALTGANTYTGVTTINGGTLLIGNNGTAGSLAAAGTIVDNGILGFSFSSGTITQGTGFSSSAISGSGGITNFGAGTLVLNAANSFSGAVTILAGTVSVATVGVSGTNSPLGTNGTIYIGSVGANNAAVSAMLSYTGAGETTDKAIYLAGFDSNSTSIIDASGSGLLKFTSAISGNDGSKTLTLQGSGSGELAGVVNDFTTGILSVTKTGAGTWTLSGSNNYSGTTTISAGSLILSNANAVQNSTVSIGVTNGLVFTSGIGTFNLGGLTGGSSQALTDTASSAVTLNVGGNGTSNTYSGVLSGAGALIKSGSGTQTLSSTASTFTGNIVINDGTLASNSAALGATPTASALGSLNPTDIRSITVNNGAVLSLATGNQLGTGGSTNTLAGLTLNVKQGGVFQTGSQTTTGGFWNKIGAVNLDGGTIHVGSGANTTTFQGLALIGNVTVGGTSTIASTIDNFAGSLSTSNGVHLGQNATAGQVITFTVADVTSSSASDLNVSVTLLNTSSNLTASGLTKAGAGTMTLSASGSSYTGVTTVNGGVLAVSTLANGGSNSSIGASTNVATNLVLNGGTLQYTGAAVSTDRLFSAGTSGATIDASGSGAVTFSNTGTIGFNGQTGARTLTLTGSNTGGNTLAVTIADNSGATSVTKSGAGTWVLSGASNSYSGATLVNAGTLTYAGAATIGSVSVADGATLGFKVTSPSASVVTATSLALGVSGTSNLAFDFSNLANPTAALMSLSSGVLALNGTVNITLTNTGGLGSSTDTLKLLSYTSQTGVGAFNLVTTTSGHTSFSLDDTATALYLNVTAATNVWTGAISGTWDIGSSGGATGTHNWSLSDQVYLDGDKVQFDDSASRFNVSIASAVTPGSVTFSNSSAHTYTLSGAGITGSGTLALNGTNGTVILINTNTYTGITTIGVGDTLQLGDGTTDGSISSTVSITDNGSLIYNRSTGSSFTYSGVISGTGSVMKSGTGTQVLSGANSYSGGTTLNNGILQLGNGSALGASSGAFTANGGTLDLNGNSPTVGAFSGGSSAVITNNSSTVNATLTAGDSSTTIYAGQLTNGSNGKTLAFTKQGTGTMTLTGSNSFSGGTTITAGTLKLGNANALGATTGNLAVNAGTLDLNGNSVTVGALSGNSGTLITSGAAGAITLASNSSANSVFAGVIQDGSGTVSFAKSGTGILGLTGSNTYSGGTTISGGTIGVAGANGTNTNLGSGLVTINSGGILRVGYNVTSNTNISTTGNSISLNGGTIYADDANQHLTGTLDVTSLGGILGSTYNAGTNAAAERDKGLAIDGLVTGSGALTIQHSRIDSTHNYDTSFVSFSNNSNTYSGTVTVNENTATTEGGVYLGISGSTALANASVVLPANVPGTTRRFGNSPLVFKTGLGSATIGSLSGAADVVLTGYNEVNHAYGADAIALSVGGNNATTTYSGVLSGGGSLTKTGTGTFTLTGLSTYSGTTTVSAGTLLVSGSISGSTTSVSGTGTLGGAGGTTGAVTVGSGGNLAPGAGGIGTLSSLGNVALNSGSTFQLEINTTAATTDLLAITGNLSLANTNDAILTISDLAPSVPASGVFTFVSYTGTWNGGLFTYNGSTLTEGSTLMVGSDQFTIDYAYNGNSVALLAAVPEPGAASSLVGGFGMLLGLQRFRRRRNS